MVVSSSKGPPARETFRPFRFIWACISYQKERLYWGLIDSLVNWLVTGYRKEAQSKRAPARAITNIERDRLLKIQREVLSVAGADWNKM